MPSLLVILIGLVLIDFLSACDSNPCVHGICQPSSTGHGYTCRCPHIFSGDRCQVGTYCIKNPCRNHGTCHADRHFPYYKCTCPRGYHGDVCELNKCDQQPCRNNGLCHPTTTHPFYACRCPAGYSGTHCETHECERHPCNNGTCYRTATSPHFACSCFTGYHGLHCQYESCKEVRCYHGGTCRPTVHSPFHTCSCLPGFQGTSCLHRVPPSTTTAKPAVATINTDRVPPSATTAKPAVATINTDRVPPSATSAKPAVATINTDRVPPSATTAKPAVATINTGPTCLACSNVVSPDTCENIVQCGIHEVCYVDQFVNSIGSFRFNLGCRDKAQCDVMQRGDSQNTASGQAADTPQLYVCTECCRNSLCNSGGCGEQGFQSFTSGQRGPICFKCEQQSSPNDCNKIRICGRDEVCMLNTTSVGTSHQMLWKSDCQKKSTCQHTGVISSNSGNGGCSNNCCSQDLCNNVC